MRDLEDAIDEIKKETIESRGLIIKVSNLTNSLAADIKAIAKRQASYEQRFRWNGGVAYVLFALLAFAGLKLYSDARFGLLESENEQLRRVNEQIQKDVKLEQRRLVERERTEERAAQFYDLIKKQRKQEASDLYAQISKEPLSKVEADVFREAVTRFKTDLSWETFQQGLDLVRSGRYAEAAEVLKRSLSTGPQAAHASQARYHLAFSLFKLDKCSESLPLLRTLLDQQADKEQHDDASWLLAKCTAKGGNIAEARTLFKSFLRKWPRSPLAPQARQDLAELK